MRATEFITEYDRSKTELNYGLKMYNAAKKDRILRDVMDFDVDPKDFNISELLAKLEKVDPTKQKKYTEWMARLYSKGQTQFEDLLSKAGDYIEKFEKLKLKKKLKGADADINRIKALGQLGDMLDQYPDPDADKVEVDKGKSKKIYEDEQIRVIQLGDEAAAKYYGQNTRWCTAAKNNNMFSSYNDNGPLFVILIKNAGGEKYQFHFETGSFMDVKDQSISVAALVETYPSLAKAFRKQAIEHLIFPLAPDLHNMVMENLDDIIFEIENRMPLSTERELSDAFEVALDIDDEDDALKLGKIGAGDHSFTKHVIKALMSGASPSGEDMYGQIIVSNDEAVSDALWEWLDDVGLKKYFDEDVASEFGFQDDFYNAMVNRLSIAKDLVLKIIGK